VKGCLTPGLTPPLAPGQTPPLTLGLTRCLTPRQTHAESVRVIYLHCLCSAPAHGL